MLKRVPMADQTYYSTVKIHKKTLAAMRELKHPGQTYDGFINELLELYRNANPQPVSDRSTSM